MDFAFQRAFIALSLVVATLLAVFVIDRAFITSFVQAGWIEVSLVERSFWSIGLALVYVIGIAKIAAARYRL